MIQKWLVRTSHKFLYKHCSHDNSNCPILGPVQHFVDLSSQRPPKGSLLTQCHLTPCTDTRPQSKALEFTCLGRKEEEKKRSTGLLFQCLLFFMSRSFALVLFQIYIFFKCSFCCETDHTLYEDA